MTSWYCVELWRLFVFAMMFLASGVAAVRGGQLRKSSVGVLACFLALSAWVFIVWTTIAGGGG